MVRATHARARARTHTLTHSHSFGRPPPSQARLSARCADEVKSFTLAAKGFFARLYAPLLVRPLGTLEPSIRLLHAAGGSDNNNDQQHQVKIRAQLFFRCAVQMHCQPLSSLLATVKRRGEFKALLPQLEVRIIMILQYSSTVWVVAICCYHPGLLRHASLPGGALSCLYCEGW